MDSAPQTNVSKFGGPVPPRKPESRTPLLWLVSKKNQYIGHRLFLVNLTGEVLDHVTSDSGGYQTVCDDVFLNETEGYSYKNVQPGEAVKIAHFDGYDDLDFILSTTFKVKSTTVGQWTFNTPEERGGFKREKVLLWLEEINNKARRDDIMQAIKKNLLKL